MSRTLVSLLLAASMVSGVFFFTINNSAEYDEDFYEDQPYLSYDLRKLSISSLAKVQSALNKIIFLSLKQSVINNYYLYAPSSKEWIKYD